MNFGRYRIENLLCPCAGELYSNTAHLQTLSQAAAEFISQNCICVGDVRKPEKLPAWRSSSPWSVLVFW